MTNRRILILVAGVGAIMLVTASLLVRTGAPPDPAGPDGTLGLRRLLRSEGIEVREGGMLPAPPATFLLLADFRTPAQDRKLLAWAQRGGRLVVADSRSALLQELGASPSPVGSLFGDQKLAPGCVGPDVVGVGGILADPRDGVLTGGPSAAMRCFRDGPDAYELSMARGLGSVVLLAGSSFLANRRLAEADDALFAVRLLGPGGPVVFGSALAPGAGGARPTTVWGALPDGARAAIAAVALALLAVGLARGRRLGRPVLEDPVSPIPASELVHASAGLFRRARAVSYSADRLRLGFAARVGPRVGAPPGAPAELLVEGVARVSGQPKEAIERLLVQNPPTTDDGLIAVARELEDVARRVTGEDGVRAASPVGARVEEGTGQWM